MTGFRQPAPQPTNRWRTQPALRYGLERRLSSDLFHHFAPRLDYFAECCATDFPGLAAKAETTLPRHSPYDSWGNRIDQVEHSGTYDSLVREGQQSGLVAVAYEHGTHGRLIQSALLTLFEPVAATATCPLAMSDAAATALAAHDPALHAQYGARLTTRQAPLTCGQWMTETSGGSDFANLATIAEPSVEGLAPARTQMVRLRLRFRHRAGPCAHA